MVSARDPDIARTKTVQLGDQDVKVLAYSDDKRWLRFVASRMTSGVPVLEELVGTPWPGGLTTVREDLSVNLRGYDGWFDSSEDSITIGEQLDQELLYHELLHAWASGTSFEERWLYEGIAQYLAARAVTTQGDEPARLKPASTTSKQAMPLNTWGDAGGRASADGRLRLPRVVSRDEGVARRHGRRNPQHGAGRSHRRAERVRRTPARLA